MVTPHGTGESLASPAVTSVTDRLHVLVVDDEASVRVALQRYLSSRGHEVETTASGREALARMREDAFDAVIIDMRMPDVSGGKRSADSKPRDPPTGSAGSLRPGRRWTATGRPFPP